MNDHAHHWTEREIAGHPCRLLLLPAEARRHTILYLHQHDPEELEADWFTAALVRHNVQAVCPVTGPSWWSDRICAQFDRTVSAERYLMEHVLAAVNEVAGAQATQIGLLGLEMGGQGALRLAYKRPSVFPVVAAVSPAIDYQQRIEAGDRVLASMYRDAEEARQDTATLHIHPLNWPRHQWFCCDPNDWLWYDSVERLRMKLYSLGVPYECDLETQQQEEQGGDYSHAMIDPALEFITTRLDQLARAV